MPDHAPVAQPHRAIAYPAKASSDTTHHAGNNTAAASRKATRRRFMKDPG